MIVNNTRVLRRRHRDGWIYLQRCVSYLWELAHQLVCKYRTWPKHNQSSKFKMPIPWYMESSPKKIIKTGLTRILLPLLKGSLKIAWGLIFHFIENTNKQKNTSTSSIKKKNNRFQIYGFFKTKNILYDHFTIFSRSLTRAGTVIIPLGKLWRIANRSGQCLYITKKKKIDHISINYFI